jgi:hypothetical protein
MQTLSGVNKTDKIESVETKPARLRRIRITKEIAEAIRTVNTDGWIHVMSFGKKWKVRKHGAERALGVYTDKEKAITAALKVLDAPQGKILFVHDSNGNVEQTIHK